MLATAKLALASIPKNAFPFMNFVSIHHWRQVVKGWMDDSRNEMGMTKDPLRFIFVYRKGTLGSLQLGSDQIALFKFASLFSRALNRNVIMLQKGSETDSFSSCVDCIKPDWEKECITMVSKDLVAHQM